MKATIRFGSFPKLTPGNDCDGSEIIVDEKVVGHVRREIDWRDVGTVSIVYRAKIEGYRVALYVREAEPVFPTIAEARAYVRAALADDPRSFIPGFTG